MGSNVKESDYMTEMKSLTLNDKTYDCFVDSVARTLASATAVIESVSGESVTVSDASDVNLYGLRIFGKTMQDGTPTPDAPVDLVSVGSGGSITVGVTSEREAQSMTIATPNGLPGIPVESGGNYTDVNGQQWVCDEIDLARGVYVQRVGCKVFDGSTDEIWNYESQNANTILLRMELLDSVHVGTVVATDFLCSNFEPGSIYNADTEGMQHSGQQLYLRVFRTRLVTEDVNGFRLLLAKYPMVVHYVLGTPIKIPLSSEEIAAYKELRTYREPTTVSNNDGAYMELEYVMDAKKYINSLVGTGGGAAPARLSSVTIHASAWNTDAEGLHSQVVAIDGVTEYSKVDLLPSVEQLAIFHNKDVAFVTENEDGVVTVFAIGDKPIMDYTMQVSITEVVV
jgi:hypothetical protein